MPRPTKVMQEAKQMQKTAGRQLAIANTIIKEEKQKQDAKKQKQDAKKQEKNKEKEQKVKIVKEKEQKVKIVKTKKS